MRSNILSILFVLLFTVSNVSAQAAAAERGLDWGLFGPKETLEEHFEHAYRGRLLGFQSDQPIAEVMAREEIYLKLRYTVGTAERREAARVARNMLARRRDRESQPGAEWREMRSGGDVIFRIDLTREKLEAFPSATMNDAEKAAYQERVRREILRDEHVAEAVRDAVEVGERPAAAAWIRKNLIVRIEFEGHREVVCGVLDDPPMGAVPVLDGVMKVYRSTLANQVAIAGTRRAIATARHVVENESQAEIKKRRAEIEERHRFQLERANAVRAGLFERLHGYSPPDVDPTLDVFAVHTGQNIFDDLIIARAIREIGPNYEAAAADPLRKLAEYDAVLKRCRDAAAENPIDAPAVPVAPLRGEPQAKP